MKNVLLIFVLVLLISSCKEENITNVVNNKQIITLKYEWNLFYESKDDLTLIKRKINDVYEYEVRFNRNNLKENSKIAYPSNFYLENNNINSTLEKFYDGYYQYMKYQDSVNYHLTNVIKYPYDYIPSFKEQYKPMIILDIEERAEYINRPYQYYYYGHIIDCEINIDSYEPHILFKSTDELDINANDLVDLLMGETDLNITTEIYYEN